MFISCDEQRDRNINQTDNSVQIDSVSKHHHSNAASMWLMHQTIRNNMHHSTMHHFHSHHF